MNFSAEDAALLSKLLEKQKAVEGKDPDIASAERAEAQILKELESAQKKIQFLKIGAVGDIPDESKQEKAKAVLKNLQIHESLISGKSKALSQAWIKDKGFVDFLNSIESSFVQLSQAVVELVHSCDLGDYRNHATEWERESRKRQRTTTQAHKATGCTCGSSRSAASYNEKCSHRCPCRISEKACTDNCACTAANCQNPAGVAPARARGRKAQQPVDVHVPDVRYAGSEVLHDSD